MTNLQYSPDLKTLIEQWMQQEMQGIQFPVDFDVAWKIAGYSTKGSAKRKLPKSAQKAFFCITTEGTKGRPKENIRLSIDGLKGFLLIAANAGILADKGIACLKHLGMHAEFSAISRVKPQPRESVYSNRLAKALNGHREVQCKAGAIDVLTDSYVIEVKEIKGWKAAIGQALVYGLEYPDKKPCIYLYGECSKEYQLMILSYANRLGVMTYFADTPDAAKEAIDLVYGTAKSRQMLIGE